MKKTVSLRKNKDFLKMYRSGNFYVGKIMVIYVKKNNSDYNKLGITTVRNYGKSVERNRMRRLIKESYRLNEDRISLGWDIVFSVRKRDSESMPSYKETERELKYLLKKTGLMK